MSSDPTTPLLTVEDLRTMVAERNELWERAQKLSVQIEHIRQFIGDERFVALVGRHELGRFDATTPTRRQRELSMGDVMLEAIEGVADGVSYDDLRKKIAEAGLPRRSSNSFFNAVARLHEAGSAVRAGGRLFSTDAYTKLSPERRDELQKIDEGGRGSAGIAKATIDTIRKNGKGMTSSEVITEMTTAHPGVKSSTIYATLSRLKIADALVRDSSGRYALPQNDANNAQN